MDYKVKLDNFAGPLDLLLHLIRKEEMDIHDIPIAKILDQYLAHLKVIQDLVPNHIGSGHWWMKDLPAPDWLSNRNQFVFTSHARTTVSDPYASAFDKERFTSGWFDSSLPDKNHRNPQMANYEIQNAIWWIESAGLAGLRVDTYAYSDAAFIREWTRRRTPCRSMASG
jgi:glycosidase